MEETCTLTSPASSETEHPPLGLDSDDSDKTGGLLSSSDSLEYVLLGLLCSEPLTRGEDRLSNVTRWVNGSLLAC